MRVAQCGPGILFIASHSTWSLLHLFKESEWPCRSANNLEFSYLQIRNWVPRRPTAYCNYAQCPRLTTLDDQFWFRSLKVYDGYLVSYIKTVQPKAIFRTWDICIQASHPIIVKSYRLSLVVFLSQWSRYVMCPREPAHNSCAVCKIRQCLDDKSKNLSQRITSKKRMWHQHLWHDSFFSQVLALGIRANSEGCNLSMER